MTIRISLTKIQLESLLFLLGLTFGASFAHAQHSDIWVVSDNGAVATSPVDIETNLPTLVDATTGKFLYASTFGDGFGPYTVDDPGMQSESNALSSDGIFNYRAVGDLWFWNGAAWVDTLPNSEAIQITDALGSVTLVEESGITNSEGAIDFVSGGFVHQHVDFELVFPAGGAPAVGAYMMDMEFFITDGVGGPILEDAAHSVRVAFNFQMPQADFDLAIAALTSPAVDPVAVPIPYIFVLGLACLLLLVYRRIARPRVN